MEFSQEKFDRVKQDAETFYATIGQVHCPYFGEPIHFNAKGLDHLKFKHRKQARVSADQYVRFRHLETAPKIIRMSKTLQGIRILNHFEHIKINDRWNHVMKLVTYYEFVAIMESRGSKVRLKVIVKEIAGGEKFFWSIIPFWGMDKINDERVMYDGDPEED
jgi:hypothetical protein